MLHNGIEINEVDNTTHFSSYYYEHKDITQEELKRLKTIIEPTINRSAMSTININLTKGQAFDILFAVNESEPLKKMGYLPYNNLLREFIYRKKSYKLPFVKK